MRTAFGAELSLDLPGPQNGVPDPAGTHLLVGLAGYRRLARVRSSAHLRGQEKGRPVYDLDEIVNDLAGHALVLTGGRKGPVGSPWSRTARTPPQGGNACHRPGYWASRESWW